MLARSAPLAPAEAFVPEDDAGLQDFIDGQKEFFTESPEEAIAENPEESFAESVGENLFFRA